MLEQKVDAFPFLPAPAIFFLFSWQSRDSDGPRSPSKYIQGSAPYAEHFPTSPGQSLESPTEVVSPNRECHLPLNSVGNTSEPNVLAASRGKQLQHQQSKVASLFPLARLVDTHALSSSSSTWRAGHAEQWKGHLLSQHPLRDTLEHFPAAQHSSLKFPSLPAARIWTIGIRMKGFGEACCLHKQLKRGKPIPGLSDSGKSFSVFQVRSWISTVKQTEELTSLKGICRGCTHFEVFPY